MLSNFTNNLVLNHKITFAYKASVAEGTSEELPLGYPRKNPNRGLRIYFFGNPHGIFHFFTLPLKIPEKTKFKPGYSTKLF